MRESGFKLNHSRLPAALLYFGIFSSNISTFQQNDINDNHLKITSLVHVTQRLLVTVKFQCNKYLMFNKKICTNLVLALTRLVV